MSPTCSRPAQVRAPRRQEGPALAEIWNAEDREHARRAVADFKLAYGAKFGKAVAKVTDDLDELLASYDFPAGHWGHLRTTNPIESTFAPVRHRTKVTKDPAPKPPASPWRSSSSRPLSAGGAPSTHPNSSYWSAPAPASNAANSSNDPPSPPRPQLRPQPQVCTTNGRSTDQGRDAR
jgi:hypothetical protein